MLEGKSRQPGDRSTAGSAPNPSAHTRIAPPHSELQFPPKVPEGAYHPTHPQLCPEHPQTMAFLGFLRGPEQLPWRLQLSVGPSALEVASGHLESRLSRQQGSGSSAGDSAGPTQTQAGLGHTLFTGQRAGLQ
jgi:hypothetical protein